MEGQLPKNGSLKMKFALCLALLGDCLWDIMSNCQFGNVIGTPGPQLRATSLEELMICVTNAFRGPRRSYSKHLSEGVLYAVSLPPTRFSQGPHPHVHSGYFQGIQQKSLYSFLLSFLLLIILFPSSLVVSAKSRIRGAGVWRLVDKK